MRRAWLLVLCGLPACDGPDELVHKTLPTSTDKQTPVLCIVNHASRGGLIRETPEATNEGLHPVELAAFDDGTLVWRDGDTGHRSYARAKVTRTEIDRMLGELEPLFERVPREQRSHFGLDAHYRALTLRGRDGTIRFESWHGDDPQSRAVATDHGLEARQGRSDEQLEREWSDGYRAFRTAWRTAVAEFEALRPEHGEPLDPRAVELTSVELGAR